jgi:hypothetical protein
MAGNLTNLLQARPHIPSPQRAPQNRPGTPTVALTWLQAGRAPWRPSCCVGRPLTRLLSQVSAKVPQHLLRLVTSRPYTRAVPASIFVVPRIALVARGEPLPRPGTCETAMHGSTDTTGGRGAELLRVTCLIQHARK